MGFSTMRKILIIALLLCFPHASSFASEFGTKEEALALVEKAEAFIKSVGTEKAVAALIADPAQFRDRDLYISVVDIQGMRLFHGQNPKLIGKTMVGSVDVNDKPYGNQMIEVANTTRSGWVEHAYKDPITSKVLPKITFVKRVDNVFVTCGIYVR
jgi:cytochrome c